mmetsp:Transcript_39227/g.124976  ORF Transcript_39227/g.124976 Transcript_39227/m.124976 type:complete len:252 (-) Transcript_39227:640-1395(-)
MGRSLSSTGRGACEPTHPSARHIPRILCGPGHCVAAHPIRRGWRSALVHEHGEELRLLLFVVSHPVRAVPRDALLLELGRHLAARGRAAWALLIAREARARQYLMNQRVVVDTELRQVRPLDVEYVRQGPGLPLFFHLGMPYRCIHSPPPPQLMIPAPAHNGPPTRPAAGGSGQVAFQPRRPWPPRLPRFVSTTHPDIPSLGGVGAQLQRPQRGQSSRVTGAAYLYGPPAVAGASSREPQTVAGKQSDDPQ